MLVATIDVVRGEIKAGKSLSDIKKAGLPAEWKKWESSFVTTDRWVETIYNSLQKPPASAGLAKASR